METEQRIKRPRLKTFVLMPLLRCNANCTFCSQRLERHDRARNDLMLSLEKWFDIIRQGMALGLSHIIISGGEPTLYPDLLPLVRFCKTNNLHVTLNTNGIAVSEELVQALADLGLDSCVVSLYSHKPNVHDELKGVNGAFQGAIKTLELLKSYHIPIYFLAVLTKKNLSGLAEYLEFIRSFKPVHLYLSYLEGDNPGLRPSAEDIHHFQTGVLPRSIKALGAHLVPKDNRSLFGKLRSSFRLPFCGRSQHHEKLAPLRNLYRFEHVSINDLAKGVYNPATYNGCGVGNRMCLILANGDVLPCLGVQYWSTPPVGNIHETLLNEIWYSELWERARKRGSGWCRLCPMGHHVGIRLRI
ncbi:radical SAM protein [Thermodesulfobacteriota bacterium]